METFTLVDGIVAILIVMSALLAFSRGFTREVMAIAGWIVAALLAFNFAGPARPLVQQIPYVGDFLGENCQLLMIVAFAIVLALALMVASLFTPLFSSLIQRTFLGGPDQALGFVFGVVRGVVLVAVCFLVYHLALGGGNGVEMIDNSRSMAIFNKYASSLREQDPSMAVSWFNDRANTLLSGCGA